MLRMGAGVTWRERLAAMRAGIVGEGPSCSLTKPTKAPFGSFGSRQDGHSGNIRAHLLALAEDEGLPAALVHGLGDAEVASYAGEADQTLRACLRALNADRSLDAGMVPPDWGEPVARVCEGCGPVLLWPTAPETVTACPWCFRRNAGKAIPRPLVTCEGCRHYLPGPVNPAAGGGSCAVADRGYWPMQRHRCPDWRPC